MTRTEIVEGLDALVLILANGTPPPEGWTPQAWAYLKGIASAELHRLRDRLVEAGR
jgi:hypothetical protein